MALETLVLEYVKTLVWPVIVIVVLVVYRDLIAGLIRQSKVKLSLFGVEFEVQISKLEQVLTAPVVGGKLTDQQWALLDKIAAKDRISVADEGYKMYRQGGDLSWIRQIRNAGLIITYPDDEIIELAEQIGLTPLGKLLMDNSGRPKS